MKNRASEALRRAVRTWAPVVLAMAAFTSGGAAWAVVPTHCVSLDVPAPMILPDGTIHPAGELRLCLSRNYNPVTGMHKIYVDRMPVGMLLSRVSNAEVPKDSKPAVLFYGSLESGLRLSGYTVASNGKVFSYMLWNPREAQDDTEVTAASSATGSELTMEDSGIVLLAARLE